MRGEDEGSKMETRRDGSGAGRPRREGIGKGRRGRRIGSLTQQDLRRHGAEEGEEASASAKTQSASDGKGEGEAEIESAGG